MRNRVLSMWLNQFIAIVNGGARDFESKKLFLNRELRGLRGIKRGLQFDQNGLKM